MANSTYRQVRGIVIFKNGIIKNRNLQKGGVPISIYYENEDLLFCFCALRKKLNY
jgi:hypothetical protein